jgi:formate dehydrogenase
MSRSRVNHPVIPIAVQALEGPSAQRRRSQPRGRQVDAQALAEVQAALKLAPGSEPRRELLIEYLHGIQNHFRQLSAPHIAALAQWMGLAQTEVFEVASFYHHFDIVREDAQGRIGEAPELTVRVCDGLACQLAGADDLLARLPALLGTEIRVVPAPCIGACDRAPAVHVHQHLVAPAQAEAVQAAVSAREVRAAAPAYLPLAGYLAEGGYALLRDCLAGRRTVDSLIATLEQAGLRGLGGAGFPSGRKWRIVREQPAPRWMAVNVDEGEPGTFKDRWCLETDPHRFLEGMLVAAWAVDAVCVVIYLRDEYHGAREALQTELDALAAAPEFAGLALPKIELRRGAGAYICGEESAMLESIEGKRGMPRLRPPYVAQVGLFGRPTLVHNLESLYWVRELVERGGAWFAEHGRNGRRGLRRFSVSGRVKNPGVKLAPAGISLRELVDEYCGGLPDGHRLYAYLPGGASGGILPASLADVPLDFDTLQPHGAFIGSAAVMVLTESDTHRDRAMDAARNLMQFFEHESCGQCTPCRAGTAQANQLMATDRWDTALMAELSQLMRDASICGLGQAAPNPMDCVVRYFPHELER